MVFEQIFKVKWIESKPRHAFILGFIYSVLGIICAYLILQPDYAGLMSIGFTSLLLVPSLNKLLAIEENQDVREKKLSLKLLFKDHYDIIEVYIFLFLGILLAYAVFSLILPTLTTMQLFRSQLVIADKLSGNAVNAVQSGVFFKDILKNNLIVLIVCLVFSLIYGAGSILFLTLNASVWGVVFGYVAKSQAVAASQHPFIAFILIMVSVFPHMIVEASSYFFAIIGGGIVSKAVIREELGSKKFNHVFTDGLIFFAMGVLLVFIAAILEAYLFPYMRL